MYTVLFGQYGDYETFEQALEVTERLQAKGEDAWICSDEPYEYEEEEDEIIESTIDIDSLALFKKLKTLKFQS